MKLCNVCGKELKRPHPGCNRKEFRASIKELAKAAEGLQVTQVAGSVHFGPPNDGKADPLSSDIASMGQPARDAILRRMVTQREKQR